MNSYDMVMEFHEKFNCAIGIGIHNPSDRSLRVALIREELRELADALDAEDMIEVADALGDLDYVVNGAAIAFGIHLPSVTAEVHRSNMTKMPADGIPLLREDGKVLKGPLFELPDIRRVLYGETTTLGRQEGCSISEDAVFQEAFQEEDQQEVLLDKGE